LQTEKWANYLLSGPEWDIIRLAQDCLEVCLLLPSQMSSEYHE